MSNSAFGFRLGIEGEREFKSKLSEINQNMKVLGSELKVVSSAFDGQEKSVRSLSARNDVLKKTVDEQKEKVRLLTEALQNASESFGENDRRTKEWQVKLNNATAELNKMERELNDNERELSELEKAEREAAQQADHLGDEVEQTGNQAKKSGRKLVDMKNDAKDMQKGMDKAAAGIKTAALAIGAAIAAAGAALTKMTVEAAEYADEMLAASQVTGMSTDSLQAYSYAAELIDVPLNTLTKSMAKNVKAMSEAANGSKKYTAAYEKLGVKVTDTDGKLRNSEDVYWELIDALKNIDNETERDALSMQLFGKSAQELNPLIEAGSAAVKDYTAEAKRMGAVLDGDTLELLGEFDDEVQRMKQGFKAAKNQLGTVLLPELKAAAKWAIDKLAAFTNALKNPQSEARKIIKDLKDFATVAGKVLFNALKVVADVLLFLAKNIKIVIPVVGTLVTAFLVLRAACSIHTAIIAVQAALAALPATATAAKVAMTGLSAAMNSNVVGIVLTAAAAVVGLAIALKGLCDSSEYISPVEQRLKELKERADALNESYKEINERRTENIVSADAETKHLKKLADELDSLADESGNVKDADKARAEFILGQLNEALGTEYEMTGNQIKNYQELKQSIYDVINAKKAQILLDTHEEAYKAAVEGKTAALETYTEQLSAIDEAERKLAESEQALADLRKRESEQGFFESIFAAEDPFGSQKSALNNTINAQKEKLEELRKSAAETSVTVAGYYSDIELYENASALIIAGNTDEAIKLLETRNTAFISAGSLLDKSVEEQKRILGEQYSTAKANYEAIAQAFREGVKGITQEMVDDAKELAEMAGDEYEAIGGVIPERMANGVTGSRETFSRATRQTVREGIVAGEKEANSRTIGSNLVDGLSEGVRNGTSKFRDAMKSVIRAGITAAKAEAQIKSPSRKMRDEVGHQIGKGAELGITDATAGIKSAIVGQMREVERAYSKSSKFKLDMSGVLGDVNSDLKKLSDVKSPIAFGRQSNVFNLYPRELTQAQIDYLITKVNLALGTQI